MSEPFDPDWVISPGETLREWMEENGLSLRVTAMCCAQMDPARLRGILDGKRKITTDAAHRLAHGTGIPARLWLNLERAFRQGLAEGKTWVS